MNISKENSTYYEILEVSPHATHSEIQRAYQRAKWTYSQDNPALYGMFSREEASELLRMIEEAYSILSNQSQRKTYDDSLHSSSGYNRPAQASPTDDARISLKDLPDFGDPLMNETQQIALSKNSDVVVPSKNTAPAPRAASFQVDENFEREIKATQVIDGAFMQRVRLYKNISLEKISEISRVSRTYLDAVERDDFKALPAPVFVRGFVVQMARALGLDEKLAADSYMSRYKKK